MVITATIDIIAQVGRWIKIKLTFKLGRLWKAVLTILLFFFWMGSARISVLLPKAVLDFWICWNWIIWTW